MYDVQVVTADVVKSYNIIRLSTRVESQYHSLTGKFSHSGKERKKPII